MTIFNAFLYNLRFLFTLPKRYTAENGYSYPKRLYRNSLRPRQKPDSLKPFLEALSREVEVEAVRDRIEDSRHAEHRVRPTSAGTDTDFRGFPN